MAENDGDVGDKTQGITPEVLAEAKQYGWVPKEDYRGKSEWVDADEFVRRGRSSIPILRQKLTAEQARVSNLTTTVANLEKDMETVRKIGYAQAEKEWKDRYEALKAQKAEALKDGEHSDVVELDEALEAHRAAKPAEPKKAGNGQGTGPTPEEKQWLAENPWYNTNKKLTARANAIGVSLSDEYSGMELLEKVREEMELLFPEDMGVEPQNKPGMTHGSRRRTGADVRTGNEHTYDNLPADARAACDRLVKSKRCTQQEYLDNYQWD